MTRGNDALRVWLESLSGLLIWLTHFALAYGAASLSLQFYGGMPLPARIAVAIISVLLVCASVWLATRPLKKSGDLPGRLRIATNVLAVPSLVFQTLPVILTP